MYLADNFIQSNIQGKGLNLQPLDLQLNVLLLIFLKEAYPTWKTVTC